MGRSSRRTAPVGRVLVGAAVLVLAGCTTPSTGPDPASDAPPGTVVYAVEGCRLLEPVVPADIDATHTALPAGYDPIDYGEYWGGPPTGDAAISVVWFDCPTYRGDDGSRAHAEVLLGAYVTVPTDRRPENATPYYVFDTVTTNPVYADAVAGIGWSPRRAETVAIDAATGGRASGRVDGIDGTLGAEGTYPGGDQQTGTFAFENHHAVEDRWVRQRFGFDSFPYRTAPTTLSVDGVPPLDDLVGSGTVRGMGFYAWDVTYDATVTAGG